MRKVTHLVVHCTATAQSARVESIQKYWRDHLGWKSLGYHVIVPVDGVPVRLASDEQVCNGVAGHNSTSLHVSYIGGVGADGKTASDTRTPAQKRAILDTLKAWRAKYPNAVIQGHRDFPGVSKACPSFDARSEYARLLPV